MMNKLRVCVIWGALAAMGVTALAAQARASDGWNYGYAYYPYGFLPTLRGEDRYVPYYAAHPPVYYSHIVARPYGYSPYPYYPGIVTPDFELSSPWHPGQPFQPYWDGREWKWRVGPKASGEGEDAGTPEPKPAPQASQTAAPPRPVVIKNVYYREAASGDQGADRAAGAPVRITNPYVVDHVACDG